MLAAAVLFLTQAPDVKGPFEILIALIILNLVAERLGISVYGETYLTIGFVFTMAIVMLFGLPGAVIIAPLEALASRLGRRKLDYLLVTNAALFVVANSAAYAGYSVIAQTSPEVVDWTILVGAALGTTTAFGVNAFLLSITTRLKSGQPLAATWEKSYWLLPHYLAMGAVGAALAMAGTALGMMGIIAFVVPAFMMRVAIKQYVDKTAEHVERLKEQNEALRSANIKVRQARDELRETYDGTLEALVTALDARDQETKGHSVRVARYMLNIAAALGVKEGTQEWEDMQRGALLHDVGKIGVRDEILLKPAKLSEAEWEIMRRHPEIGYNMLREVRFSRGRPRSSRPP